MIHNERHVVFLGTGVRKEKVLGHWVNWGVVRGVVHAASK